jgi:hypothetical protein
MQTGGTIPREPLNVKKRSGMELAKDALSRNAA